MAALIDQQRISATQRAEIYEEGVVWIIDDNEHKEIKLVLRLDIVDKLTSPLQTHFGPVFGDEAVQTGLLFLE